MRRGKAAVASNEPESFWLSCSLWFLVSIVQIQLTGMERILGALMGTAKLLLGYSNQLWVFLWSCIDVRVGL